MQPLELTIILLCKLSTVVMGVVCTLELNLSYSLAIFVFMAIIFLNNNPLSRLIHIRIWFQWNMASTLQNITLASLAVQKVLL